MTPLANGELPNEIVARRIVSDVLGVSVERYEGHYAKHNNMVDAVIKAPTGDVPLEVVSDTEATYAEMWAALNKLDHSFALPAGSNSWMVQLRHTARVKYVKSALPGVLAGLRYRLFSQCERGFPQTLRDLGVTAASPIALDPPRVSVLTEGFNSWDKSGDLNQFIVDTLLVAADVPAKLQAHTGGVGEAHAFIWATISSNWSVTRTCRTADQPFPSSVLRLPEGVTDVWVACSWRDYEAIHYNSRAGWTRTGWVFTDEIAEQLPLDFN